MTILLCLLLIPCLVLNYNEQIKQLIDSCFPLLSISSGIGDSLDEAVLIEIAGDEERYFHFTDFETLLDDVSLILGQSCLATEG